MFPKLLCKLVLIALVSPNSLHAQLYNPFHGVTRIKIDPLTYCYMSENHVLIEVSADSDITFTGEDITLHSRSDTKSNPCYPTASGYRLPPADDNRYIVGMNDRYVLIDYGCCPGVRRLEIYELARKSHVWRGDYFGDEPMQWLSSSELLLWQEISGDRKDCALADEWEQKSGLGFGFEAPFLLNLETSELERTGEAKCSARQ